jgi:hypothetical protein
MPPQCHHRLPRNTLPAPSPPKGAALVIMGGVLEDAVVTDRAICATLGNTAGTKCHPFDEYNDA